jgi:hypothetical protein
MCNCRVISKTGAILWFQQAKAIFMFATPPRPNGGKAFALPQGGGEERFFAKAGNQRV